MPGFGSALSEDERWALIDFIHARNVGRQAKATGQWAPPIPAPSTPLDCDGDEIGSLAELGSHDLLVVADAGAAAAATAQPGRGSIPGAETIRLARDAATPPERENA